MYMFTIGCGCAFSFLDYFYMCFLFPWLIQVNVIEYLMPWLVCCGKGEVHVSLGWS